MTERPFTQGGVYEPGSVSVSGRQEARMRVDFNERTVMDYVTAELVLDASVAELLRLLRYDRC